MVETKDNKKHSALERHMISERFLAGGVIKSKGKLRRRCDPEETHAEGNRRELEIRYPGPVHGYWLSVLWKWRWFYNCGNGCRSFVDVEGWRESIVY